MTEQYSIMNNFYFKKTIFSLGHFYSFRKFPCMSLYSYQWQGPIKITVAVSTEHKNSIFILKSTINIQIVACHSNQYIFLCLLNTEQSQVPEHGAEWHPQGNLTTAQRHRIPITLKWDNMRYSHVTLHTANPLVRPHKNIHCSIARDVFLEHSTRAQLFRWCKIFYNTCVTIFVIKWHVKAGDRKPQHFVSPSNHEPWF